MSVEAWQPIPGYEGFYEASSIGRIRSVAREVTALREGKPVTWRLKSRMIKPRLCHGYPTVTLSKDGIHDHWRVHRLMLVAFVGPCPEGMEGLHANDIRTDNRRENLRWGTRSDNMRDALRNGTHPTGSKTHCKRGHEFTPENTGTQSGGGRLCLTCSRDQGRERARKKHGWKPRVYWDDATHCRRGHERTPENTYTNPNNPTERSCRECRRIASAERYRRSVVGVLRMEASLAR